VLCRVNLTRFSKTLLRFLTISLGMSSIFHSLHLHRPRWYYLRPLMAAPLDDPTADKRDLEHVRRFVPDFLRGRVSTPSQVEVLDLTETPFSDRDMAHLRTFVRLQVLNLSYTDIGDLGLKEIQHLKQLEVLDLCGTNTSDVGMSALTKVTTLFVTRLDDTNIGGSGGLASLASSIGLSELSLNRTRTSDSDFAKLAHLNSLTRLSVSGTNISGDFLNYITLCKNLQVLNLSYNPQFKDNRCKLVGGFRRLNDVDLSFTGVGDGGLAHIIGLSNLHKLNLKGTTVSDVGLSHLSHFHQLVALNLDDTLITDMGMEHLTNLAGLRTLTLCGTRITDLSCSYIQRGVNLKQLDLQNTHIGDDGASKLMELGSLKTLNLDGTRVTKGMIDKLRKRLKNVEIRFRGGKTPPEGVGVRPGGSWGRRELGGGGSWGQTELPVVPSGVGVRELAGS
jgi:internalin A